MWSGNAESVADDARAGPSEHYCSSCNDRVTNHGGPGGCMSRRVAVGLISCPNGGTLTIVTTLNVRNHFRCLPLGRGQARSTISIQRQSVFK